MATNNSQTEISLTGWKRRGRDMIMFLNVQIADMKEVSKNHGSVRKVGSAVGMTGAVIVTGGIAIAMAPLAVLGGATAAVVTLAGGGISFLGTAINAGSRAVEMKTENSKADFIMAELNAFLRESEELLNVLNNNKLEKHGLRAFTSEAFQKLLPCVGTTTAVCITGAHSVALAGSAQSVTNVPPVKVVSVVAEHVHTESIGMTVLDNAVYLAKTTKDVDTFTATCGVIIRDGG